MQYEISLAVIEALPEVVEAKTLPIPIEEYLLWLEPIAVNNEYIAYGRKCK